GVRLDPPSERRNRAGKLELVAVESASPRWLGEAGEELERTVARVRVIGSMAIALCQVAATRVDGMASLWRCRSVDVAAAQLIVPYAGLEPLTPLPAPEAVSRAAWSAANLRGMAGVLDPMADRIGAAGGPLREPLRAAAGLVLGAEVGGFVGLLSQRVMGQYEVPPTDPDAPARLLFVAPNLAEAADRLAVDAAQLLRW